MVEAPDPDGPNNAVEQHGNALIARAVEIARNRPDLRMVALVAEADAPEAPSLRAAPSKILRGADGSVAVIMTRESAKDLLLAANPWLLEFLESDSDGSQRGLPVIHAARHGMRTGLIKYELPE